MKVKELDLRKLAVSASLVIIISILLASCGRMEMGRGSSGVEHVSDVEVQGDSITRETKMGPSKK